MVQREINVILHNVRSSENVGSIFRTADAAGAAVVYLSGYTPTPVDRFGRTNQKLAKASLGAEKTLRWERAPTIEVLIADLKRQKIQVVAVEQDSRSASYETLTLSERVAFIFGNEVDGIPKEILMACDAISEIPMHGKKESLNVSVSAGIILFHARSTRMH